MRIITRFKRRYRSALFIAGIIVLHAAAASPGIAAEKTAKSLSAREVVEKAFNHMRGDTSVSRIEMTIHRPDFERRMVIRAWTEGRADALFFIEAPAKDAGNGTLKRGRDMWTYNPKVNRVIKLPPSMMSQSWMGSDFSNNDLARTDSILTDYDHATIGERTEDGVNIYEIESIPHETAPVVWGKQEMSVRDDGIMVRQAFFDQDGVMVKEMVTEEIGMMGGRLFPKVWTMRKAGTEDRYTRIIYQELEFDVPLEPGIFTLTRLKSRRR